MSVYCEFYDLNQSNFIYHFKKRFSCVAAQSSLQLQTDNTIPKKREKLQANNPPPFPSYPPGHIHPPPPHTTPHTIKSHNYKNQEQEIIATADGNRVHPTALRLPCWTPAAPAGAITTATTPDQTGKPCYKRSPHGNTGAKITIKRKLKIDTTYYKIAKWM